MNRWDLDALLRSPAFGTLGKMRMGIGSNPTIVTTEANELMSRIHPRMPVILHTRDYDRWLDREESERLPLDLLRPLDSEEMEMYEANAKVGTT